MRTQLVGISVLIGAVLLAESVQHAQTRPDFTGTWIVESVERPEPPAGGALVTESTQTVEGPMGQMSIKRRDVRSLGGDGLMTVRTSFDTPRGTVTATVVFSRAAA